MSWDEWVDVQMEARPISGRANQASRTLFHGPMPWASGGVEAWGALVGALGVVYRVFVDPWFGSGGGAGGWAHKTLKTNADAQRHSDTGRSGLLGDARRYGTISDH
eukprot:scaffold8109_cov110-Isochrysis_galbana.AAC.3